MHCSFECQRMAELNSASYKYDSHTTQTLLWAVSILHKNQNNSHPPFGWLWIGHTSAVQVLKALWTDYLVGKGEPIHWHDKLCDAGNLQIPRNEGSGWWKHILVWIVPISQGHSLLVQAVLMCRLKSLMFYLHLVLHRKFDNRIRCRTIRTDRERVVCTHRFTILNLILYVNIKWDFEAHTLPLPTYFMCIAR